MVESRGTLLLIRSGAFMEYFRLLEFRKAFSRNNLTGSGTKRSHSLSWSCEEIDRGYSSQSE